MTASPWTDYAKDVGEKPDPLFPSRTIWDFENFPFVVRWSVATNDRLTRWRSYTRKFATLADAVAAYKRPFRGIDVDLVQHNGGKPGQHLTTLAERKARQPTKWHESVPQELRAA